jgi:hypothetical protein
MESLQMSNLHNCVYEELELIMNLIRKIVTILNTMKCNTDDILNYYVEIENEHLKTILKFLDVVLNCFLSESKSSNYKKLYKLYDFLIYDFKRLRNKYSELEIDYFSFDSENQYIENIKIIIDKIELKNINKLGYLYLRLNYFTLNKIYNNLQELNKKDLKIRNEDISDYQANVID